MPQHRFLLSALLLVMLVGCGSQAQTATVTVTTHAQPARHAARPAAPARTSAFSGQGQKNLGTIVVAQPSTLHWTCSGSLNACSTFAIDANATTDGFLVSSNNQPNGTTAVDAGAYQDMTVITAGTWTIRIVPNP